MNVLLTGATGYIGRRLQYLLLADSRVKLRLFVTDGDQVSEDVKDRVDIVEGTTFDRAALGKALKNIDTAYYLIHSMGSKKGDFEDLDRISAENFIEECLNAGVKRVIYLGGLGEKGTASKHLQSRIETGEILSRHPHRIQTIWFRAAIIIGSGGASFEIIRNLVEKIPVMIAPRWVKTRTQPVAVDDVLSYLAEGKDLEYKKNLVVDIGGEAMSFHDMLSQAARIFNLKRLIIPVPLFSPKLSSYWLILITPIPFKIASALVEGLKSETIIKNDNGARFFPGIKPVSYKEAMIKAVKEVEDSLVSSRWCDSSGGDIVCSRERAQLADAVVNFTGRHPLGDVSREKLYEHITSFGGDKGWFAFNMLWKIRGFLDKIAGGSSTNIGRRSSNSLRVGDIIGFWKVIDLDKYRRMLLLATMKVPGKAWLEFTIGDDFLEITAYFIPRGLLGRIYWYSMLPIHAVLFRRMAANSVRAVSS